MRTAVLLLLLAALAFAGGCGKILDFLDGEWLDVEPDDPVIRVGQSQQFTAVLTVDREYDDYADNVTREAGWVSSNINVATIDANGLATGVGVGAAKITASFRGEKDSTTLTVLAAPANGSVQAQVPAPAALAFTLAATGRRFAYVLDRREDAIRAYLVEGDGSNLFLGQTALPPGSGPRRLALHPSGQWLYVACWSSRTVHAFRIEPWNGGLSPAGAVELDGIPARLSVDPETGLLVVADPVRDQRWAFRVDAETGALGE